MRPIEKTGAVVKQPIWFTSGVKGYRFSLTVAYLIWMAVVISLYPLCKRYDACKLAHKEKWWLSYLQDKNLKGNINATTLGQRKQKN